MNIEIIPSEVDRKILKNLLWQCLTLFVITSSILGVWSWFHFYWKDNFRGLNIYLNVSIFGSMNLKIISFKISSSFLLNLFSLCLHVPTLIIHVLTLIISLWKFGYYPHVSTLQCQVLTLFVLWTLFYVSTLFKVCVDTLILDNTLSICVDSFNQMCRHFNSQLWIFVHCL